MWELIFRGVKSLSRSMNVFWYLYSLQLVQLRFGWTTMRFHSLSLVFIIIWYCFIQTYFIIAFAVNNRSFVFGVYSLYEALYWTLYYGILINAHIYLYYWSYPYLIDEDTGFQRIGSLGPRLHINQTTLVTYWSRPVLIQSLWSFH